jgi:hypothetical protein
LQIDNSLILANQAFADLEEKELENTKFTAKPKEKLTKNKPFHFNNYILRKIGNSLQLLQKSQRKKLELVKLNQLDTKQKYIEQRARGAYITSIC